MLALLQGAMDGQHEMPLLTQVVVSDAPCTTAADDATGACTRGGGDVGARGDGGAVGARAGATTVLGVLQTIAAATDGNLLCTGMLSPPAPRKGRVPLRRSSPRRKI